MYRANGSLKRGEELKPLWEYLLEQNNGIVRSSNLGNIDVIPREGASHDWQKSR